MSTGAGPSGQQNPTLQLTAPQAAHGPRDKVPASPTVQTLVPRSPSRAPVPSTSRVTWSPTLLQESAHSPSPTESPCGVPLVLHRPHRCQRLSRGFSLLSSASSWASGDLGNGQKLRVVLVPKLPAREWLCQEPRDSNGLGGHQAGGMWATWVWAGRSSDHRQAHGPTVKGVMRSLHHRALSRDVVWGGLQVEGPVRREVRVFWGREGDSCRSQAA